MHNVITIRRHVYSFWSNRKASAGSRRSGKSSNSIATSSESEFISLVRVHHGILGGPTLVSDSGKVAVMLRLCKNEQNLVCGRWFSSTVLPVHLFFAYYYNPSP